MKRPVIGVFSAKHDVGRIQPAFTTNLHYIDQLAEAGGIPIQIPAMAASDEDIAEIVSRCDGFLLPGGGDFDCRWYGERLLPNLEPSGALALEVQDTVLRLVRMAVAEGKPILGICLGEQVLNIALGGSLYQDLPTQMPGDIVHFHKMERLEDRWYPAHSVRLEEGSLIQRLSGADEIRVNSFHHQAVRQPAPSLRITAWSPDGVPEAIEHVNGCVLGVQWHPENLAYAGSREARNIFRWLAETSAQG